MSDNAQQVYDMAIALQNMGSHYFRNGKILAFVGDVSSNADMLIIGILNVEYDGIPVEIDLPLILIGYTYDTDPLSGAYDSIANFIRNFVGK
jgi:hypothetical protein